MSIITYSYNTSKINKYILNNNIEVWNASIKIYPQGIKEVYRLKNAVRVKGGGGIRGSEKDEKRKQYNQDKGDRRARTKIREIIIANDLRYHWTFHYGDDVEDREVASYDFMKFIQRLNYYEKDKLPYIAVMEIQQERKKKYGKEVIHFHLATDRYIRFEDMLKIWGHGGCYVTKYSGDVMLVALYMTKYITKSKSEEQVREIEQKRYLRSKGLKEPIREQLLMSEDEFEKLKEKANIVKEFEDGEDEGLINAEWIQIVEDVKKG